MVISVSIYTVEIWIPDMFQTCLVEKKFGFQITFQSRQTFRQIQFSDVSVDFYCQSLLAIYLRTIVLCGSELQTSLFEWPFVYENGFLHFQ